MIEVNVTNLKSNVRNLDKRIKSLEEIKLNMFNQLEDSCVNWHDGHSLIFNSSINLDSTEAENIIDTLNMSLSKEDKVPLL